MDGWNTICWGFHSISTFLLQFQGVLCFLFGSSESLFFSHHRIQSLRSRGIAIISMTWTALPGALPGASFRWSYGCHMSYLARDNITIKREKRHTYQTLKQRILTKSHRPGKCDKSLRPSWRTIFFIAGWWFVMGWVSGLLDIGWATCDWNNRHVSCFSTGRICHGGCEARHTCFGTLWSTWLFTFLSEDFRSKNQLPSLWKILVAQPRCNTLPETNMT